ncbi:MAG: SufE family protein [Bacteroidota bacterium]
MRITEIQSQLVKEFEELETWEEKYSKIIKIGKELSPLPNELKVEKNKIDGCQSQVWVNAKLENGKMIIVADSDAMIVKGLIALLIKVYSGHEPIEILNTPPEFLQKIGIDKHLSPTRKNGLGAMLKQIQLFAFTFNALSTTS